ncbi:ACP phosphodiesterase [Rapidithrix thailandica]|uniref:ACP phosphodiesterase n=1 Tax=Rapidithrix thailandica TaxID=413964 RepID=A0AAW9RRF1_9BACT
MIGNLPMNYLAHAFLAGKEEELIFGNFIADHIKGKQYQSLPVRIGQGVMMHRYLDSFTDSHKAVMAAKQHLWSLTGKMTGVVVDILFDHYLSTHWALLQTEPLKVFTTSLYRTIRKFDEQTPESAQHMLHYMEADDWLYHYQFKEGMRDTLGGINRRTKGMFQLTEKFESIMVAYPLMETDFEIFLKDVRIKAKEILIALD